MVIIHELGHFLGAPLEFDDLAPENGALDWTGQNVWTQNREYLSAAERAVAPRLHAALDAIGNELQNGKRNFDELEEGARRELEAAGFVPDYVAVRRAENLEPPDRDCDEIVVLAAAQLGKARLIDNIVVSI